MVLIFREFLSRAGDEERVLTELRKRAAAMVRNGRVEAVLVCQRVDVPQRLLWIQHHAGPSVTAVGGDESLPPIASGFLEEDGAAVRAEFVDGAYQFPLPPCRVWVVETSNKKTARALLNTSRLAASDCRICGVSVYRTVEDPSRMMAFFALAADVTPADYFAAAARRPELTFYPLRVSWTVGRLTPGASSVSSLVRYPRAAFWARLGLVSPSETTAIAANQIPDNGNETEPQELRMNLVGAVYVITCGHCGQTWRRTSLGEGQTMECIFCGRRGRLSLGAIPNGAASGAPQVEAWLH